MEHLFFVIFNQPLQLLSQGSIESLMDIGDWYKDKHYTYIRVFGCSASPHIFPKYVLDILIMRKISYQIVEPGIISFLSTSSKSI
jgi:hypothetical protein